MSMVFWERKGVLLVDFLLRGDTINSLAYCETLKKIAPCDSEQEMWNAEQQNCFAA